MWSADRREVSGLFEKCVREGTKMFQQVKKQNLRSWRSAVFLKNVSTRDVTNLTHEFVTHYGELWLCEPTAGR